MTGVDWSMLQRPPPPERERLPMGDHAVVLEAAGLRSRRDSRSVAIEVAWAHLRCPDTGARFEHAWMLLSAGWTGAYEQDRCRRFALAVAESVGWAREHPDDVDACARRVFQPQPGDESAVGCLLRYSAVPRQTRTGREYRDYTWFPVTSTPLDRAARRAAFSPEHAQREYEAAECRAVSLMDELPPEVEEAEMWMSLASDLRKRLRSAG